MEIRRCPPASALTPSLWQVRATLALVMWVLVLTPFVAIGWSVLGGSALRTAEYEMERPIAWDFSKAAPCGFWIALVGFMVRCRGMLQRVVESTLAYVRGDLKWKEHKTRTCGEIDPPQGLLDQLAVRCRAPRL